MAYSKQLSTLVKLETENQKALRKAEDKALVEIRQLWAVIRKSLKKTISDFYRQDFPRSNWNLTDAKRLGTLYKIELQIDYTLNSYTASSVEMVRKSLISLHDEARLRNAWMLDMVTPNWVKIKTKKTETREAGMVNLFTGAAAKARWDDRWAAWTNAYRSSLTNNLMLNLINEGSVEDAVDEVDASKAGSPAYSIIDALERLFVTEAIGQQAQAAREIRDANRDVVKVEIWQTREDSDVCDICDENDGEKRNDVRDEVPAHPGCRCFWRVVPQEWQSLLKKVDPALAREMDMRGLVPDAMIIRDENGDPAAALMVTFKEWQNMRMAST